MDIARCTLDDKTYTIWVFNQLPPAAIERYRRHLLCEECGFKAYYRKESSDGKPPCFGATHQVGCKAASSSAQLTNDERHDIEDVNKIVAAGNTIRINFALSTKQNNEGGKNSDCSGHYASPSKRYSKEPAENKIISRGLKTILNYLIRSPEFAESDTLICTDDKHCWKAKNLIVPFEKTELDKNKRPHMYWGMISHSDKDMKWLNTGGQENVSIPISSIRDILIDAFDIEDEEDFSGAYAIVFGWCKEAMSGKLYIDIKGNDPSCIFIKRATG